MDELELSDAIELSDELLESELEALFDVLLVALLVEDELLLLEELLDEKLEDKLIDDSLLKLESTLLVELIAEELWLAKLEDDWLATELEEVGALEAPPELPPDEPQADKPTTLTTMTTR